MTATASWQLFRTSQCCAWPPCAVESFPERSGYCLEHWLERTQPDDPNHPGLDCRLQQWANDRSVRALVEWIQAALPLVPICMTCGKAGVPLSEHVHSGS